MKHANAIGIPRLEKAEKIKAVARPQSVNGTDLAQSDVGVFILLTILLIGIGRAMGSWLLSEQIKIQKGPGEFVSRNEEYQKLHDQVGPNSFRVPGPISVCCA